MKNSTLRSFHERLFLYIFAEDILPYSIGSWKSCDSCGNEIELCVKLG